MKITTLKKVSMTNYFQFLLFKSKLFMHSWFLSSMIFVYHEPANKVKRCKSLTCTSCTVATRSLCWTCKKTRNPGFVLREVNCIDVAHTAAGYVTRLPSPFSFFFNCRDRRTFHVFQIVNSILCPFTKGRLISFTLWILIVLHWCILMWLDA